MSDVVAFSIVVIAFAVAATAHVAIALGLSRRRPRWHGVVALFVVPLAPYWAFRESMRIRAAVWIVGVVGYAIARAMSVA
jgi:hypothetical protein